MKLSSGRHQNYCLSILVQREEVKRFIVRVSPRQQKINEMNGAHLVSPIRGELGYADWPQLGTQFIALLGTKFGHH